PAGGAAWGGRVLREDGAADTADDGWRAVAAGADDPALPAGIEPLRAAVDGPPALRRRLAQIGVVADAQTAQARHGDLRAGQRLVTRAGGLWRWDGLVRAAADGGGQAVRLEQRNRLAAVQAAATTARGELTEVTETAARAGASLAAAEQTERAARDHLRTTETARDAARSRRIEIEARLTSVRTKLLALDESAARIAAERAEIAEALTGANDEIATLANVEDLRGDAGRLRAQLADFRSDLLDARAAHDRLTREAENRRARLAAIGRDLDNWRDRLSQAGARVEELRTRQAAETAEIARLDARPAEIAEQRRQLADARAAAETARKDSAERLAAAETAADEIDRQSKTAARGLAEARETMVRAEGGLDHANQAVFQLKERIAERLSCAPSEILAQAEIDPAVDFPEEADLVTRLERLTRERENIGPVNLRAEQEIEELQEQIAGMEHERDDLTAAIARLRGAIGALNREGRQRLTAAFDAVNGHFQDLFRKLFGGGEARLALTEEDDPFEAGLEIFASPPGKKMQTMSLLSGGEQALTALALVFAAFLTNPAPICVLDEVDAPLDDSNVARFCGLLGEIAATTGTRFLVITHHRMTMARMDRLFGVTMAERGVSQLVSVDLRGAEQLRETG
ncbi:MAG: chromosome partitioning protein ParA, partial [Thalassobaculaceae bacterium]